MITSNDISILIVTRVNNHERLRCVYDNIRSFYPTNEIVIIYDGVDTVSVYADSLTSPATEIWTSLANVGFSLIGQRPVSIDNFIGIIADVQAHVGSTDTSAAPNFNMPIDGNYTPSSNTVTDTAGSNNGTFVNIADGDSVLYTRDPDGNWVDGNGNVLVVAYD